MSSLKATPTILNFCNSSELEALREIPFELECPIPICGRFTEMKCYSMPIYSKINTFKPRFAGLVLMCPACHNPVFIVCPVSYLTLPTESITLHLNSSSVVNRSRQSFPFEHLPQKTVARDFIEALDCYSIRCFNAFAAMCRRTIQSVCTDLGATGKEKVKKQIADLRDLGIVDDDNIAILEELVIHGGDAAHPHLPPVEEDRAIKILALLKDLLSELYITKWAPFGHRFSARMFASD